MVARSSIGTSAWQAKRAELSAHERLVCIALASLFFSLQSEIFVQLPSSRLQVVAIELLLRLPTSAVTEN